MVTIIPAILATNEQDYSRTLKKIEDSGVFENGWIQIDLMDGEFVPNKSIGVDVISKYQTTLNLEAHLMVEQPDSWITELLDTPIKRIIFPIEDNGIEARIQKIRDYNKEVGLVLNPETSVEKVKPYLDKIDVVLMMSVHPGKQGQEFIPETIEKIKEISHLRSKGNFRIAVDGGITAENAKLVVDAGADNLVIGSHLIEGNIDENLEVIWEKIQNDQG